jgi:hypothetical protein
MHCKRCGAELDSSQELCEECKKKMVFSEITTEAKMYDDGTVTDVKSNIKHDRCGYIVKKVNMKNVERLIVPAEKNRHIG